MNSVIPTNTLQVYKNPRRGVESPECMICGEVSKRISCLLKDTLLCHRADSHSRNLDIQIYHCFHKECLATWFKTSHSQGRCPTCRIPFSEESIQRGLAPSLEEKCLKKAQVIWEEASRGAYYGAWSWSAVQLFTSHPMDLSDCFQSISGGALSYVTIPPLLKSRYGTIFLGAAGILQSRFSSNEWEDWMFSGLLFSSLFFSREGIQLTKAIIVNWLGVVEEQMRMTERFEDFMGQAERFFDKWSWKTLPFFVAAGFYRSLT